MKNILFLLIAFFYSGFAYSQDSSERKAVAKQGNVNNQPGANYSDKSKLDQSARGISSVNSTDTIPHQTTGDYNEKKRSPLRENGTTDEPK